MPAQKKLLVLEERVNTITHGIGAGLSITALVLLLATCRDCGAIRMVSFSVYGASLVLLYLASAIYHGVMAEKLKEVFARIDHSAIYLLIAGTYTPFTLLTLKGPWGWTLFGVIWGLAIIGVAYKLFFYQDKYRAISAVLYIGMGWLAIFAIKPLIQNLPTGGLIWLFAGGLSYSFGVIFYLWEKLPFNHGIWHLFVLGGSICHFIAVYYYV
ncbi:MAG: hemolysin III family protein [Lewinellaceae bacterium]|nr:hemolysin III family protein [Lewinellaceae bacterium]